MKYLILLPFLLGLLACTDEIGPSSVPPGQEEEELLSPPPKFKATLPRSHWLEFPNDQSVIGSSNEERDLIWVESYILQAIILRYKATLDPSYLHLFVCHTDKVFEKRDDHREEEGDPTFTQKEFHKEMLGQPSRAVWSNLQCPRADGEVDCGTGFLFGRLASTGMLTYPIMDFIRIVKEGEDAIKNAGYVIPAEITNADCSTNSNDGSQAYSIGKTLLQAADQYQSWVVESVDALEEYWNPNASTFSKWDANLNYSVGNGGGYKVPNFASSVARMSCCGPQRSHSRMETMPGNQQYALGRTLVLLHQITKDRAYLLRAQELADDFLHSLKKYEEDFPEYAVWDYWNGWDKDPTKEDMSHGAISVLFAVTLYEAGIRFTQKELIRLANTLNDLITPRLHLGVFNMSVHGQTERDFANDEKMTYHYELGSWLELARHLPPDLSENLIGKLEYLMKNHRTSDEIGDLEYVAVSQLARLAGTAEIGEACVGDRDCRAGLCHEAADSSKICREPKVNGEHCNRGIECFSGICDTNICTARFSKGLGQACERDDYCGGGMICSKDNVCEHRFANGTACDHDIDCESNLCVGSVCEQRQTKDDGQSCSRDLQCKSHLCWNGTTCRQPIATGSNTACFRDKECESLSIISLGHCVKPIVKPPDLSGEGRCE